MCDRLIICRLNLTCILLYNVIVSKLSKIFWPFQCHPFDWGCKGKSLYFMNQNYLKNFQKLFEENSNRFSRKNHSKNYRFFKRDAKIRGENLLPNFIWFFSSRFHVFPTYFCFNEQPFLSNGRRR